MVRHVVCFKMKEGCSAAEAKEMLLSMRGREETALSVEVGIDALRSPRSYDLILSGLSRPHGQAVYAQRHRYVALRLRGLRNGRSIIESGKFLRAPAANAAGAFYIAKNNSEINIDKHDCLLYHKYGRGSRYASLRK